MNDVLLSGILQLDCVDELKVVEPSLKAIINTGPERQVDLLVLSWRPRLPGHLAIIKLAPRIGSIIGGTLALFIIVTYLGIARDRKLEWRATHDSLTGLPNRAAFYTELNRLLSSGFPVAVGLADLNGFKQINDLHGHSAGDDLLRSVAVEILAAAAAGNFVARLGGDEFAWISPCLLTAQQLKSELTSRLERPLSAGELKLTVKVTIGLALSTPSTDAESLLEMADNELYRYKAQLHSTYTSGLGQEYQD